MAGVTLEDWERDYRAQCDAFVVALNRLQDASVILDFSERGEQAFQTQVQECKRIKDNLIRLAAQIGSRVGSQEQNDERV